MPRHRGLAADRAAARAGGERRHGILGHPFDIVLSRHDVKIVARAARFDGNENLPPEAGFERPQSGGGGTAQCRLDRRADDQTPIGGGPGTGFSMKEAQGLEGEAEAALADTRRFQHCRAE